MSRPLLRVSNEAHKQGHCQCDVKVVAEVTLRAGCQGEGQHTVCSKVKVRFRIKVRAREEG